VPYTRREKEKKEGTEKEDRKPTLFDMIFYRNVVYIAYQSIEISFKTGRLATGRDFNR